MPERMRQGGGAVAGKVSLILTLKRLIFLIITLYTFYFTYDKLIKKDIL